MTTTIEFEQSQQKFLFSIFSEVFDGGSTQAIQNILGDRVAEAKQLRNSVETQVKKDAKSIKLTNERWRVIYESINAVIYGLGPFELQTLTGCDIQDALNINLRICSQVFGVYGKVTWE